MNVIFVPVACLAVWRFSVLFAKESGPFGMFTRLRVYLSMGTSAFHKTMAEGIKCIWCNSVWFGTLVTIAWVINPAVALVLCFPFAMSAVAIGLEKVYSL